MKRYSHLIGFLCLGILLALLSACEEECPGNLPDRADVVTNPAGYDYDVHYNNAAISADFFPTQRANEVRNALTNAHNLLVSAPLNFRAPYYSETPNDTCVFDISNAGWLGYATKKLICIDAPSYRNGPEAGIRTTVAHELFHHVEGVYIDLDDYASWGVWTVEGCSALIEDKLWLDTDSDPASLYVGRADSYLNDPNQTLFNLSYNANLFWNYLTEQLGTPSGEPFTGTDVLQRFWNSTSGHDPDSVRFLRDTISTYSRTDTLENLFRDFAVANYTHDLVVTSLPNPDRYRYLDEQPANGATPYRAVTRTAVTATNTSQSDSVQRWGVRYFEVNVNADPCLALGFWVKAQDGRNLSYALIGVKAGNRVSEILTGSGNEFYRAVVNTPGDAYQRLALVVIGLDDGATFDYAYATGNITGAIRKPDINRMAFVGRKNDPGRFQVWLRLEGPASLTPSGAGSMSVKGLDASLFQVNLRSTTNGATYPATILNTSYVSGEYWLVVQAPAIADAAAGDLYDLEICFCTSRSTCSRNLASPKSVLYAEKTLQQMLVVDRSGSMHLPQPAATSKITAAKNAARMYINAGFGQTRIGVVSFNGTGDNSDCLDTSDLNYALSPVSSSRADLLSAVDAIQESGWTSIGDGLKKARDALLKATGPADERNIILFSDGMENEGDYWDDPNPCNGSPAVKDSWDPQTGFARAIRIDTLAFGPLTDEVRMQRIAAVGGGDYIPVTTDPPYSTAMLQPLEYISLQIPGRASAALNPAELTMPNRLANAYRTIQENLNGQDRLFAQMNDLPANSPLQFSIPVTEKQGGGLEKAEFVFNWDKDTAGVKISLRDPDGNAIGASGGWSVFTQKTSVTYQYDGILPVGGYAVEMNSDSHLQMISIFSGSILHGVDMDVALSEVRGNLPQGRCDKIEEYQYLRGLPVGIIANLTDTQAGIAGVSVEAVLTNPDGSVNHLTLFDDGAHDDSLPGDGVYANLYTRTPFYSMGGLPDDTPAPNAGTWGSYTVVVSASGTSNFGETFERSQLTGFHVSEFEEQADCIGDGDNDDLPDRWEDYYGLDQTDPNHVSADYDLDGLSNKDEFMLGTLPWDPDTDDGGESDGSEVKGGLDPLYERDDRITAMLDYGVLEEAIDIPIHMPRSATNILHFPVGEGYQKIQVWRTDPNWSGYQLVKTIDLSSDRSGIYDDTQLVNGYTYSYYLVAEGLSGVQTPPTAPFTGTPRAGP